MSETNEKQEEQETWQPLDDVVRKWIVMSQWEKDQNWYKEMKENYE
jgi:hypothetical protein